MSKFECCVQLKADCKFKSSSIGFKGRVGELFALVTMTDEAGDRANNYNFHSYPYFLKGSIVYRNVTTLFIDGFGCVQFLFLFYLQFWLPRFILDI